MSDDSTVEKTNEGAKETPTLSLKEFLKRSFSAKDVLVILANTIMNISANSAAAGLFIAKRGQDYPADIEVYGNIKVFEESTYGDFYKTPLYEDTYMGCSGELLHIGIQCSYTDHKAYQLFVTVWCIFLLALFFVKVISSMPYKENDLRFYLSYDRFTTSKTNLTFVYLA